MDQCVPGGVSLPEHLAPPCWVLGSEQMPTTRFHCCPPPSPASLGTDRWKAQLSLPALLQIFGDYYHFWHRAVTKRSLSPHRLRHSRLQREPQVSAAPAPPAATFPFLFSGGLALPPRCSALAISHLP